MIKAPNSILSFILSIVGLAVILDYLLWPRTINASDTLQLGIYLKIYTGLLFLLLSIFFRNKGKRLEHSNGWIKASGILNIPTICIYTIAFIFYIYIQLTK